MCFHSCGPWEYNHGMPQPSARTLWGKHQLWPITMANRGTFAQRGSVRTDPWKWHESGTTSSLNRRPHPEITDGEMSSIIGWDPSVSKTNRLHDDILHFFFIKLKIVYVNSSKWTVTFLSLEFEPTISRTWLVLLELAINSPHSWTCNKVDVVVILT